MNDPISDMLTRIRNANRALLPNVELERRNVGLLPDNLKDAIDAFRHDDVVQDALGDHLAERLLEAKALEWREYRMQVTPWELDHYLDLA